MKTKGKERFVTVESEGGLLPLDFLEKIARLDAELIGLTPESYHLLEHEKINEAVNRAWDRLVGCWVSFKSVVNETPLDDHLTRETRERWLLPLFDALGYGRLVSVKAITVDEKSFPLSHFWQKTPIHLIGRGVDLDRRTSGVVGAAKSAPHGMVQEFLNRSDEHLWGFVSNGRKFRILRDNVSLTRQAYVEFDLEGMMDGEQFSDFRLLWLLCHQSRVEADRADDCWLERWAKAALDTGVRVREHLRSGVETAITILGSGFIQYPSNSALRSKLSSGTLTPLELYREILRIIYRLLFLFVAEDRELLLHPNASSIDKKRYRDFYSTQRLRSLAIKVRGSQHHDLWSTEKLTFKILGSEDGSVELGLPALGSFLWSPESTSNLNECDVSNRALLDAIRAIAYVEDRKARRSVDFKNLRTEELGSVYESLLEMQPNLNVTTGEFSLVNILGNERKTTGSYYTPPELVSCLLDEALDPAIREIEEKHYTKDALLLLKICDPACGSGHFLIAAAHRIAKRLAAIRMEDAEASPESYREALRDVISHCIYGVDVNEMAVELCKVNLWIEALNPGRPLSFLDHHIKWGNSLLGTVSSHDLIIPDEAFKPAGNDDKSFAAVLKRRNREERESGQMRITFTEAETDLKRRVEKLERLDDTSLTSIKEKSSQYCALDQLPSVRRSRLLSDAWCAAFVWTKTRTDIAPITQSTISQIAVAMDSLDRLATREIERLKRKYVFFHWHLEFPEVFLSTAGEGIDYKSGFDVVLGNPPWVRQEMFTEIKNLLSTYKSFKSTADLSVFFLERSVDIVRVGGRIGMLTPNKWFRADFGQALRAFIRKRCRVHLLVDFGHSKDLFKGKDTFPAAVVVESVPDAVKDLEMLRFVDAPDSVRRKTDLALLIKDFYVSIDHSNLKEERWQLGEQEVGQLIDRLLKSGSALETYIGSPPIRGLISGLNEAFYVDDSTRESIVNADPSCDGLFRRLLRGRDINRWMCKWDRLWHIVIPSSQNTHWEWSDAADDQVAETIFARTFPSVHHHLKPFEQRLRDRYDKGRFWWELRACDSYRAFLAPKINLQIIASSCEFGLDEDGHMLNNSAVFISSNDLFLLAVLNSRVTWWLISKIAQHMKDGGYRIDTQFLVKLPIPDCTETLADEIRSVCRKLLQALRTEEPIVLDELLSLESRLNMLVVEAFELTEAECATLLSSLPDNDPILQLERRMSSAQARAR